MLMMACDAALFEVEPSKRRGAEVFLPKTIGLFHDD